MWKRLKGKRVCFSGKFEWLRARLSPLAVAHGMILVDKLDAKLDWLVLVDTKTGAAKAQKAAQTLNAGGASITVMSADDFSQRAEPTYDELIAALRWGKKAIDLFNVSLSSEDLLYQRSIGAVTPKRTIAGESFKGCDLSGFDFSETAFEGCNLSGAKLAGTTFCTASGCKFDKSAANRLAVSDPTGSTFRGASLKGAQFDHVLADVDFTGADLARARFAPDRPLKARKSHGVIFRNANLAGATFEQMHFVQSDFHGADLTSAGGMSSKWEACDLGNAILSKATMHGCLFPQCDFSGADLRGAQLAEADLSGANLDGAELAGCNLRGAKLGGVDLSRARDFDPAQQKGVVAGSALQELDTLVARAKRIKFSFKLARPLTAVRNKEYARTIWVDSRSQGRGWAVHLPVSRSSPGGTRSATLSGELISAARKVGAIPIRFETLQIQTTGSPLNAIGARALIIAALCEAFDQEAPDAVSVAKLIKAQREEARAKAAKARRFREEDRKLREKYKIREAKAIEKRIEKAVGGKVTDIPAFLKALEFRADPAKAGKAMKMLQAERFQLFCDITPEHLAGVVKSQTDPDLVYACRIESNGHYACCTQNLNICGGLRGSICKHLLVLIIGLVKAGELDPAAIDRWIAKSASATPELNKETMGEIFIRYKGAEAGEVDWRPTETVPEDYYAL